MNSKVSGKIEGGSGKSRRSRMNRRSRRNRGRSRRKRKRGAKELLLVEENNMRKLL